MEEKYDDNGQKKITASLAASRDIKLVHLMFTLEMVDFNLDSIAQEPALNFE